MTLKREKIRIIGMAVFLGLLVWIINTLFDYYIFYEGTFLDLLILDVPQHETYIRTVIVVLFVFFGYLSTRYVDRIRRLEMGELEAFQRGVVFASKDVRNKMVIIGQAVHLLEEGMMPPEKVIDVVKTNNRTAIVLLDNLIDEIMLVINEEYLKQIGTLRGLTLRDRLKMTFANARQRIDIIHRV